MKAYEEMARDVLARAQTRRSRNRKVCTAASSLLLGCLTLVALVGFYARDPQEPAPTPSEGITAPAVVASGLSAVYYSDGAVREESLQADRDRRQFFTLTAEDVKGLSPEAVEQLYKMKKKGIENEIDLWLTQGYGIRAAVRRVENKALLSYTSSCGFSLQVEDWSRVKTIHGECDSVYGQVELALYSDTLKEKSIPYTYIAEDGIAHSLTKPVLGSGHCWLYGEGVTLFGETCRIVAQDQAAQKGSLALCWKPSALLWEMLADDPDFAVPTHDMFYTVEYEDGTREEHRLEVQVQDGQGYVTYLGAMLLPDDAESLLTNGAVCG